MQKFQRFVPDHRFDLPHYNGMKKFIEEEFQAYARLFITPDAKVVKNWMIENAGGLTARVNQTTDSTLFATERVGFEDFHRHFITDDPITLDLPDNDVSYVEVQIFQKVCAPDTVAIWDTSANSGAGAEVTQTVDLVTAQDFRLVSNTVAFTGDADKLPLAIVTTSGGVITLITDSREFLFDADAYSFGAPRTDTGIWNLKIMYDALTTIIKEFKNTPDWFTFKTLDDANQPVRLFATTTPDSNLNIEAQQIQRGDGVGKSVPALDGLVPSFVISSIDFQAKTTAGGTFTIAFPASTVGLFRRVGLTLKNDGTMNVAFSAEAASVGALADPGTLFIVGWHVGWIDLECTDVSGEFKTAGSATNVIENDVGGTSRIVIANRHETAALSKNLDVLEVTFADTPVVLTATEELVLADATNGNIAISVPVPGGNDGKVFTIKKTDNTANTVTVTGTGLSAVLDAESTIVVSSNGSAWIVIEDDRFNINLLDENFGNYIIPADSSRGAANTGFTDSASTNPRGLSVSELQVSEGIEYLYITGMRRTGECDSDGLEEFEVTTPEADKRIRLYGRWFVLTGGAGARAITNTPGDYALVTGVYDSLGILGVFDSVHSNDIDIIVDGADTGTNLSFRENGQFFDMLRGYANHDILSDSSLSSLGYDLHTTKIVNGATDGSDSLEISGFALVGDGAINESAGNAFIRNRETSFSQATSVAAPTIDSLKGSRAVRYIDPVDGVRKWAVRDVFDIATTAASISATTMSVTVASTAGMLPGDILLFDDGTAQELGQIDTVDNGTDLTMLTNTLNAYTAAVVNLWCRTRTDVDRDALDEEELDCFLVREFGVLSDTSPAMKIPGALDRGDEVLGDHVHSINYTNSLMGIRYTSMEGIESGSGDAVVFVFFGSGLDVLLGTEGTITDEMNVNIDDAPLNQGTNNITKLANSAGWQPICGALPLGWHSVHFRTTGASLDMDIKKFRTYQPKKPTAVVGLESGDLLADSLRVPDYLLRDGGSGTLIRAHSRGVVYSPPTRYTSLSNASSVGGSVDWSLGGGDERLFGFTARCNRDDAFMQRWFYGTGVEFVALVGPGSGIWKLSVDGLEANATNFPGANQLQGANFNTTNGNWDQYDAGGLSTMKVSVSGLTEGWHVAKLTNTNTKNAASSSFIADIQGIGVIGGPWAGKIVNRSNLNGIANYSAGTNRDLRVLDSAHSEERKRHQSAAFQCNGTNNNLFVSSNAAANPLKEMTGIISLDKAAPVLISFGVSFKGSTASPVFYNWHIHINGIAALEKLDAVTSPNDPIFQRMNGNTVPHIDNRKSESRSFVVHLPAGKNLIKANLSTIAGANQTVLINPDGDLSLSAVKVMGDLR